MTDTPRLWDRRADETPKSYAAFLAYVALGARRSVREAAHQNHIKTTSTGKISSVGHVRRCELVRAKIRSQGRPEFHGRTTSFLHRIYSNHRLCVAPFLSFE